MVYPLKMRPYFRHGEETPWGGHALADIFGKNLPDEMTGESLEVSAFPHIPSVITNGALMGMTFSEALSIWGEDLSGLPSGSVYPLLVKLLDAREMLSVQVHPGDEYAKAHENQLGKSESWVVLSAPRGSKLVYGVETKGRPLSEWVAEGRLEEVLRFIEVSPGDVLYIPHGLVHALGHGIMVYEVQQSSNVTYRFYDWGRTSANGKPRELHTQKALDVTREDLKLFPVRGATILSEGGCRTAYISEENFELWRFNVSGAMPLDSGRLLMLTTLGDCRITWPNGALELAAGESILVPAALEGAKIEGRTHVLCSTTPDRDSLRAKLGYRAADVAGLMGSI